MLGASVRFSSLVVTVVLASLTFASACDFCGMLERKPRIGAFSIVIRTDRSSYARISDVRLTATLVNTSARTLYVDRAAFRKHLSCHIMSSKSGVDQSDAPLGIRGTSVLSPGKDLVISALPVGSVCVQWGGRRDMYRYAISYGDVDSNIVTFRLL